MPSGAATRPGRTPTAPCPAPSRSTGATRRSRSRTGRRSSWSTRCSCASATPPRAPLPCPCPRFLADVLPSLLDYLACPACGGDLHGDFREHDGDHVMTGVLTCEGCEAHFAIAGGVPRMNRADGGSREHLAHLRLRVEDPPRGQVRAGHRLRPHARDRLAQLPGAARHQRRRGRHAPGSWMPAAGPATSRASPRSTAPGSRSGSTSIDEIDGAFAHTAATCRTRTSSRAT